MTGWRHRLGTAFLALWIPATTVVMGWTMGLHLVVLPAPPGVERIRAQLAEGGHTQRTVHVVPAGCSCTRALLDHLVARRAGPGEEAWLVGALEADAPRLAAAGFAVRTVTPEALRDGVGLKGGPALLVLHEGELAYVGGYYATPAANRPLDEDLLARVAVGGRPDPLPLFGCATDPGLAARLDPLGLR